MSFIIDELVYESRRVCSITDSDDNVSDSATRVTRWCSGYGVRLVIERSRVRLPAGALPGSLGQLSLPSLRGR